MVIEVAWSKITEVNIMELKCPEGMVLINAGGVIHPDEPAYYCMNITETPQKPFMDFLRQQLKTEYDKVVKLLDGAPKVKGDQKPAVYASWNNAEAYCAAKYPGGHLPTIRQWEKACGSGEYCTKDGILDHTRAVYWDSNKKDDDNGPMDVGSTPANANRIKDMTGNVWEWLRDATAEGAYRYFTGGSWGSYVLYFLRASYRGSSLPEYRYNDIGFRCVAPSEDSPPK